MTFDQIFTAYYSQFRADSDVPTSGDDEYTVGIRLANEAVNRWANYDNTFWKELFTTNQTDGTGAQTIVTNQRTYTAPTNMQAAGGSVRILNSSGDVVRNYPIIEPHQKQFKADFATYAYFTGDPTTGFVLHINDAPDSSINGMDIEYDYYKQPTLFTTGSSTTEMPDPYFIVHRMLASQFRAARNPYYPSAKADAENSLKQMQIANNSGTWANPWDQADNSGTVWGV